MSIKTKSLVFIISVIFLITINSCDGGEMEKNKAQKEVPDHIMSLNLKKLEDKKIYFAHQSVGFDIIQGIKDIIAKDASTKLFAIETTEISKFKPGALVHSRIGKNFDPDSKISDFKKLVLNGIGKEADVVGLKFCFLDVSRNTDVEKLFTFYTQSMAQLKENYPDLEFIHFTIPLTKSTISWKSSIKNLIKRIIGKKDIWEYTDNIKRSEYNTILINEYKGKEPVFDIAKIESTNPDGSRSSFVKDGKTYFYLAPQYSNDGAHLNELGRKKVAEHFLLQLAEIN